MLEIFGMGGKRGKWEHVEVGRSGIFLEPGTEAARELRFDQAFEDQSVKDFDASYWILEIIFSELHAEIESRDWWVRPPALSLEDHEWFPELHGMYQPTKAALERCLLIHARRRWPRWFRGPRGILHTSVACDAILTVPFEQIQLVHSGLSREQVRSAASPRPRFCSRCGGEPMPKPCSPSAIVSTLYETGG